MDVSPPEWRQKKRNGVFLCASASSHSARFSIKVRRENGGPCKVGAGLQKNEQFAKQEANWFTLVSSVSPAFTEARRGRISWIWMRKYFCQTAAFLYASRDPNPNVCCFIRLKVEQTFLKKWEYCPVQTSSQHVNHMFYLPFSSRQLIQLHPLQDVETPHNMTMKRSGKLCWKKKVPCSAKFTFLQINDRYQHIPHKSQ